MNKHWIKLLVAVVLEVIWVIGLAHSYDVWTWSGTILAILACNYFLITATQYLPTGTAYAVFVGLGAAGAVISEILFFGEPVHFLKLLFIILLLVGVIGLKLVTDQEEKKAEVEEGHE
ncbi:DMT family transporter [Ureibacillus manganicus]|uniref:Multidrug resistance protein SMR n=1 Tax=Ureibacillus manganicus DSM 26584 TaxID=1384049 RepID=A0A0A3I3L0_9BACL|nr:multidrug efflux SMR transporter [Ureibacillus manganicus]KGR79381.1 multidrug resistance protein SMR [Ureibacillus manganicus DSM 26584]